jgi:hypothetical protein
MLCRPPRSFSPRLPTTQGSVESGRRASRDGRSDGSSRWPSAAPSTFIFRMRTLDTRASAVAEDPLQASGPPAVLLCSSPHRSRTRGPDPATGAGIRQSTATPFGPKTVFRHVSLPSCMKDGRPVATSASSRGGTGRPSLFTRSTNVAGAQRVQHAERKPSLPRVAPLEGTIDRHHVVGDLGHEGRRVEAGRRRGRARGTRPPCSLPARICLEPRAEVGHVHGGSPTLAKRAFIPLADTRASSSRGS